MILLDSPTVAAFYEKWDFWDFVIFFVLGGFSLLYSILSWRQAKGAKRAAENAAEAARIAGRRVKLQEIQMDIMEIQSLFQLMNINDKYENISFQLTAIISKSSNVTAVVKEDSNLNKNQSDLIGELEGLITQLQVKFKTTNPVYSVPQQQSNDTSQPSDINITFLTIMPDLQVLISKLASLGGSLSGVSYNN